MSALKKIETDYTIDEQLEFPFDKEEDTNVTQIVALPKIPQDVIRDEVDSHILTLNDLEDKKNSALSEIERLNQYLVQKNKKLQEAKTFIEQYERVVVNKKHYIDEVEMERSSLLKEIENFKIIKTKTSFEVEDYLNQIQILKKQVTEEKNNLKLFENKTNEKEAQLEYQNKQIEELRDKKSQCLQDYQNAESEIQKIKESLSYVRNELTNAEKNVGQYERSVYEKRNELENLRELLNNFVESHKHIEGELNNNIERLKSDEKTWRLLIDERTQILKNAEIQIEAMQDEVKSKKTDLEHTQNALSHAKNKLLQVEEVVQNEQVEAGKWEDKVFKLQNKLEDLNQHFHQLELAVVNETADVEMMRTRRFLEEQEQYKLLISKESLNSQVQELELKKKNAEFEYLETFKNMTLNLERENALKDQEAKTLRLMREEEFQKGLIQEKLQMKEIFWTEVSERLDSLSSEVSNYMATCLNVNFDKDQKNKLDKHITTLAKYYHDLDLSQNKMRDMTYFLRRFQPFIVLSIALISATCLVTLILK